MAYDQNDLNRNLNDDLDKNSINDILGKLKENSNLFLIAGISLIVLGALAIIYSYASTIISVVYFGALLISVGIFEAIHAVKLNKWSSLIFRLLLSLLYIAAGIFTALYPTVNAINLTLLLAIFFVIVGIIRIGYALTHKFEYKTLVIFNGIASIVLGGLIFYQWPSSGLWSIGMLLGVDALFTGWTWTFLAFRAKQIQ